MNYKYQHQAAYQSFCQILQNVGKPANYDTVSSLMNGKKTSYKLL
jgi:hypothetical protein